MRMCVYTYNMVPLTEAIIELKRKRSSVKVFVVSDKGQVKGSQTNLQASLMQRLKHAGIRVRVRTGSPNNASASGLVHSKFFNFGPLLIIGSANYTGSTLHNVESNVLIHLNADGEREVREWFDGIYHNAADLSEDLIEEGLQARRLAQQKGTRS